MDGKIPRRKTAGDFSARNKVNQSQMFAFAINPIYTPCDNKSPRL